MTAEITIWLAGSCQGTRGPGGWGAVFEGSNGQKMAVGGGIEDATPFIAHVHSLWQALSRIKITGVAVDIHSNSDHLVNWMMGTWRCRSDPSVMILIRQCQEMCESKYLNVSWYISSPVNAEAKALAQKGVSETMKATREQLADALASLPASGDDLPPW